MKNFKKLLSSQSGVSLIEVTAAAAISVIISLGIMKTNQTGQKGLTKVTSDIDLRMWQTMEVMPLLNDPSSCFHATGGAIDVGTARTGFSIYKVTRDANGEANGATSTVVAQAGRSIGPHLRIKEIRQAAFVRDSASALGECPLTIVIEKKNAKSSFGPAEKEITIPLRCKVDSSTTTVMENCSGGGNSNAGYWNLTDTGSSEFLSTDRDVLIGMSGLPEIDIPLLITKPGVIEFPQPGTGVLIATKIEAQNSALVFNGTGALYSDSTGCFNIDNGNTGGLVNGYKHCSTATGNAVAIASTGTVTMSAGSNYSAAIASQDATIGGDFSLASGKSVSVGGSTSQAIGAGISVPNSFSTMFGESIGSSNSGMAIVSSSSDNQFTGNYVGGYRFILGPSNSGENTYITTKADDYSLLATDGNVWIGQSTVIEGNLEVKGGIGSPIINDTGAACSGANEGAQKYNKAMKRMEFCNGTSWTLF
jgi:hypothetical protein